MTTQSALSAWARNRDGLACAAQLVTITGLSVPPRPDASQRVELVVTIDDGPLGPGLAEWGGQRLHWPNVIRVSQGAALCFQLTFPAPHALAGAQPRTGGGVSAAKIVDVTHHGAGLPCQRGRGGRLVFALSTARVCLSGGLSYPPSTMGYDS